jgi:hypothetical protein
MPRTTTNTAINRTQSQDIIVPTELEWKQVDNAQIPFPSATPDGDVEREVSEFTVTGTVVKSYLKSGQYGHSLQIEISPADRRRLESYIQTVPNFDKLRPSFKWPWHQDIKNPTKITAKFVSKENSDEEFNVVWDGRDLQNLANVDARAPISYTNIRSGNLVHVEFTLSVWEYKEPELTDEAGPKKVTIKHGCTFKLLSIGLLRDGYVGYNIGSPTKKRRMAQ